MILMTSSKSTGLFYLYLLSWICFVQKVRGGDYLLLFRGKSKHTALIAPFNQWILPALELQQLYDTSRQGTPFHNSFMLHSQPLPMGKSNTFRRLSNAFSDVSDTDIKNAFVPTDSSNILPPSITSRFNEDNKQSLIVACRKCILLHGLYEIWTEGNNINDVVKAVENCEQYRNILNLCNYQANIFDSRRTKGLNEDQQLYDGLKTAEKDDSNDSNGNDDQYGYEKARFVFSVAASVLEQPNMPTGQLDAMVLSKLSHLWSNIKSLQEKEETSEKNNEKVIQLDMR